MADNNVRVTGGADGSTIPITPPGKRILLLGVLTGFALSYIVFPVRMSMDTYMHSRKDLRGKVSASFLGEVPLDKETAKGGGKGVPINEKEGNTVSEAFHILRIGMSFMEKKDSRMRVITFTSFDEDTSKTFVSHNLGISLVYTKKRALLLGTDICRGTLNRYPRKHKLELTSYLVDSSIRIDNIIYHDGDQLGLDIASSGVVVPNPAELLMGERPGEPVKELRTHYDYIIADSVPVDIIADTTIANRIAGPTTFMVRAGKLDRRQLPGIESLYQERTLSNMTLVLNDADINHQGYGHDYRYGNYGYGKYEKKK